MGLDGLIAKRQRDAGTSGTAPVPADVPADPWQTLDRTVGTSGTAETDNGQDVIARAWLLHFADRDPLEVWNAPPATHAEVLAGYPDALAAEPLPNHRGRTATEAEAAEVRTLIETIYADDTDSERAEAMQAAMADPEGAISCYRTIVAERGIVIGTHAVRMECAPTAMVTKLVTTESRLSPLCFASRHWREPGLSGSGYCGGGNDDQPGGIGPHHPLRSLPGNGGTDCNLFEECE